MDYDVKDIKLADQGRLKVEWAEATMPVLRLIRKRSKREQPLERCAGHSLPARHDGNRESGHHVESRRSRCPSLRVQSAQHAR